MYNYYYTYYCLIICTTLHVLMSHPSKKKKKKNYPDQQLRHIRPPFVCIIFIHSPNAI